MEWSRSPSEPLDQHLGRDAAGLECRPLDAGERRGEHLRELRGDHRHDREVVRDVHLGGAEGAEQAGELPAGRDRRRAVRLRPEQLGRHLERLARRVGGGKMDPADVELSRGLFERVARDQRGGVAGVELVLREVEERNGLMPELCEVLEALAHGLAEVDVDEVDAGRIGRPADQRERSARSP